MFKFNPYPTDKERMDIALATIDRLVREIAEPIPGTPWRVTDHKARELIAAYHEANRLEDSRS